MSDSAFGSPGISPTWSSSDKDYITTSLGSSRLGGGGGGGDDWARNRKRGLLAIHREAADTRYELLSVGEDDVA